MSAARVFFGMIILCVGSNVGLADDDVLAQIKSFEVNEKLEGNGKVQFTINTDIEVTATCSDSKKRVVTGNLAHQFELVAEYFADGQVRQYVVKLYGRDLGLIKVERPSFRKEAEYPQARLELTDPSDRIIGEIANAENGEKELIVRDSTRQIIARARMGEKHWEVDSSGLHPLLTAMLLCAARVERVSCEPQSKFLSLLGKATITAGTVLGLSAAYLAYSRRR